MSNIGTAIAAAQRFNLIPAVRPDRVTVADQQIFDNLPAGIYAKDLAGRYTLCNRVAAARFGLTTPEVLDKAAEDIVDLTTARRIRAADERHGARQGGSQRSVIDAEAGHVVMPPRINVPRFNAVHDGPGVLRVNDIDITSEPFGDPHFEPSNHGQTTVFNVNGDAQSFCLGGACAGLITIGAQAICRSRGI